MRIVVSGGSGKIGAYVCPELVAAGHDVTVFDKVAPQTQGVGWRRGDTQDFGDVMSALSGAEVVVHLAANAMPYREVLDHTLFRNNLIGTYHVEEASRRLGVRRVVSTSSNAVYGWTYGDRRILPDYLPVDEDHPVHPHDPYGMAKQCEEDVARGYALKGVETIVLRPAWVVFLDAFEQLRKQGGRRPAKFELCAYTEVRDLTRAFRQAVELPSATHHTLCIVNDDSTCPDPLCDVLPELLPEIGDMASGLTGARAGIANSRAKQVLGWAPQHSWRDGGASDPALVPIAGAQ